MPKKLEVLLLFVSSLISIGWGLTTLLRSQSEDNVKPQTRQALYMLALGAITMAVAYWRYSSGLD